MRYHERFDLRVAGGVGFTALLIAIGVLAVSCASGGG